MDISRRVTGLLAAVFLAAPAGAHDGVLTQIAAVTVAIEDSPSSAALFRRRGELHRLHRDWASAFADLDRAEELEPDYAEIALLRGRLLVDAGAIRSARRVLDDYLARRPESPDALFLRAEVHVRSGELESAAACFSRAVELVEAPSPDHYIARACALASLGREHVPQAIAGLDEGIARVGHAASLELRALDLEVRLGRYADALARLDGIASRSARKERWLARRGDILFVAGRCDEAREAYLAALDTIGRLRPKRRRTRAVDEIRAGVVARLGELTDHDPREIPR